MTHVRLIHLASCCTLRIFPLIALVFAGLLAAAEPASAYPLWDGVEPVADYAARVNLPPKKIIDLGNTVTMELVLIPAGKFMMGTPPPTPVDEAGFNQKIVTALACLAASGGAFVFVLGFVLIQAIRKRRRPQVSLGLLLLVTVASGGGVLSAMHWRRSTDRLQAARLDYAVVEARYANASDNEKPAHPVVLTRPFYMGKFDVTQDQYQAVMGSNPSQIKGKNNPVDTVGWDSAQEFCKILSEQNKRTVRLPSEAEWEFGCRAGSGTAYCLGDAEVDLGRAAWYLGNAGGTSHPVGLKEPNTFGLYDMHGNVWQWCQDWYGEDYYAKAPAENPPGPERGEDRVLRGGSWFHDSLASRSSSREKENPTTPATTGVSEL